MRLGVKGRRGCLGGRAEGEHWLTSPPSQWESSTQPWRSFTLPQQQCSQRSGGCPTTTQSTDWGGREQQERELCDGKRVLWDEVMSSPLAHCDNSSGGWWRMNRWWLCVHWPFAQTAGSLPLNQLQQTDTQTSTHTPHSSDETALLLSCAKSVSSPLWMMHTAPRAVNHQAGKSTREENSDAFCSVFISPIFQIFYEWGKNQVLSAKLGFYTILVDGNQELPLIKKKTHNQIPPPPPPTKKFKIISDLIQFHVFEIKRNESPHTAMVNNQCSWRKKPALFCKAKIESVNGNFIENRL